MAPDSISIDEKEKTVSITLNPRLYPQSAVMRAAYRFIDDFDVIVDGDPISKIFVTLKVRPEDKTGAKKEEMEQLASTFFTELIHANVEEAQARRYADTRNALIGAALRNLMPKITPEDVAKLGGLHAIAQDPAKARQGQEAKKGARSPFEVVYHYMPKQNCGKCGGNCEKIAKKIASGESGADMCIHLKKPEFSVVREELENALRALKNNAD